VRLRTPTVDIQGLREVERLLHQDQGVIERDWVDRQRRTNATKSHKIRPQSIRRVTESYKFRSSRSRPR